MAVGSIWISANAGSGKTTALVARVVRLLLLGVTAERICCITYTRAAAAEMRARVIGTLRELLLANDEDCLAKAAEFLGRAASGEELQRARTLFGQVLDSATGGIQLTTIHGFCQQLLRAFPLEAGVAPYFNVLEEAESELLRHRAAQRVLSGLDEAGEEVAAAIGLLIDRAHEQKFAGLIDAVFRSHTLWRELWRRKTPIELKAQLYALHGLPKEMREEELVADYCNLATAQEAAIIRAELPRLAAHKNRQEKEIARVLALWLEADCAGRVELVDGMVSLWLTGTREPRKRLVSDKDFPPDSPLRQLFDRLVAASLQFIEQRGALACAEETYALAVVARALLGYYDQLKAERGVLDYDDLIEKTHKLLSARDMTGWVMSKLDHRIDHLLIDEAQDTSHGQWKIAESLVCELVVTSGGFGSASVPRSLLVVGDEKQSIFSFQGAAPELFARMQPLFAGLLEQSSAPLLADALSVSYRSAPAILRFVDAVAARPEILPSLSALAHVGAHLLSREGTQGEVTLYPLIIPQEKPKLPPFAIPNEYQIIRSGAQLLADQVAQQIADWLSEKKMLANEDRPIAPGDILILVRNRKPIVPCLIRALQRKGVPVAGIDRLMLADHLAVKDLLALMRWVGFTGDDLALAQVLRSPLIGLSDEALRGLAFGRGRLNLWQRVRESSHRALAEQLARWLAQKDALPYEFLTVVLETDDARRRFATRFGEEVHEVLDELKEQAAHLPNSLVPSLANFAAFVAGSAREIKREQDGRAAGEVRIMTVYGAKGLEAPVVLLADTARVPDLRHERIFSFAAEDGQFPILQISEQGKYAPILAVARENRRLALLAEYHRLLYVALTRAEDELHLFGIATAKGKVPEESWYGLLETTLASMPGAVKNENGSLSLMDPKPAKSTKTKTSATGNAMVPLPIWTSRAPARPHRMATLAPSRLEASVALAPFSRFAPEAAKERGVRIHRVLQFLDADTSREELAALLAAVAPDWEEKVRAEVENEIWALYRQERWLWQQESAAEVGISGEIEIDGEKVVINGQIDRLIRTKEGMVILDYKTGRHIPASAEEVPLNYLLQLKTYDSLLARMEPATPRRAAILWTAAPRLMWLTEAVAAASWQATGTH